MRITDASPLIFVRNAAILCDFASPRSQFCAGRICLRHWIISIMITITLLVMPWSCFATQFREDFIHIREDFHLCLSHFLRLLLLRPGVRASRPHTARTLVRERTVSSALCPRWYVSRSEASLTTRFACNGSRAPLAESLGRVNSEAQNESPIAPNIKAQQNNPESHF